MHIRLSFSLLLLLAGCATQDQQTANATTQTCDKGYRTGSNIAVRDCTTSMSEEDRQAMRNAIKSQSGIGNTGKGAP
jgi:hypothetical protein